MAVDGDFCRPAVTSDDTLQVKYPTSFAIRSHEKLRNNTPGGGTGMMQISLIMTVLQFRAFKTPAF